MTRTSLRHAATAVLLLVTMLGQETWALAGTTGGLGGSVSDADTSAPIAGAQVTASSPSQVASTSTDAAGHFVFLALTPDTYTVAVVKAGYKAASVPGQTVFADAVQSVALRIPKAELKTIVTTNSLGVSSLVKSGTTSDLYNVTAATRDKVAALGGGGGLNSAYSAIATVPGAYVPLNQAGYYQTVHIRGGDYDQVGYEFDGVPVNRSFDNFPSSGASSLGNSEIQVYTGATPANSEGQGLAGYINQVIKTGTFPGTSNGVLGIGAPAFYHKATVEAGGATPDRLFSYYVGLGGFNQDFRYIDQSNGTGYQNIGFPLFPLTAPHGCTGAGGDSYISCYASGLLGAGGGFAGPGGWFTAPINYPILSSIASRDVIANVHFGIAHKHDGGRDDVQLLYNNSSLNNSFYSAPNDAATLAQYADPAFNALGPASPTYIDSYQWTCGSLIGTALTHAQLSASKSCVQPYLFPNSPTQRTPGSALNPNLRDGFWNNQQIVKAQYQKNFGSDAYLRVYGYTYYSDWLNNAPGYTWQASALIGPQTDVSPDYELSSHTRGASATFSKQFSDQNLLSIQASYTTASSIRDNNSQMLNAGGIRSRAFVAVDSTNPHNGMCYTAFTPQGALKPVATPTTCNPNTGLDLATFTTWATVGSAAGAPNLTGSTCGGGPCDFLLAENSQWATFNAVKPIFTAYSITDQWRPNDRWLVNLGLRLDNMQFNGSSTDTGAARDFWFTAYNLDTCVNTTTGVPFDKVAQLGLAPTASCSSKPGYRAANLVNASAQVEKYNVLQPRVGLTYTAGPNTVLRASFGRYAEAPNSAFQQYNVLEEDLPFALLGPNLYQFGRNTPGAPIAPPTSLNYDASLEQHLKGTDISFKLTPFYRHTQNQIQQFFLNQATGFVSGLNVGAQTSRGFELAMQKGDFNRNGLSGLLSFAYTYSTIKYGSLANGTTIISPINSTIANYNAYTSACAPGGSAVGKARYGQAVCGATSTAAAASPCYLPTLDPVTHAVTGATPNPCTVPGTYANPYWNTPVQALIDPRQPFPAYDIFPAGIGSSDTAFGSPYVTTLVLNYKHDRWAVTPSLQFNGGTRYGAPETSPGIDPAAGCGLYHGTARYDAQTCLSSGLVIPNPYTKQFDPLGSFVQPNELLANLQLSYEVSPKISLVGTLTNLINTCWGGSSEPWTSGGSRNICSYGIVGNGVTPGVGNVYNPDSNIQRFVKYPYLTIPGLANVNPNTTTGIKTPFQFFLTANVKL